MSRVFAGALLTFSALISVQIQAAELCPSTAGADTSPTFDATLLKEGRFTYHTTLKGKSLGETVLEIRRVGPNYRITMSAPKIAQSWDATVRRSFAPLSAQLKMVARGAPYEMNLDYDGRKIRGEERKNGVATPVSATSQGIVIDQRVDWASMMALVAPAGSSMTVSVYDPSTSFSPLLGMVGSTQAMSGAWGGEAVPAVRLDYTICKHDHIETYTVFATAATPRTMLREDMPNGLVSELIRVEP